MCISSLRYTPKELLLKITVNTKPTDIDISGTKEPTENEANVQMAYAAQQHLNRYMAVVEHAVKRKAVFDRRLLKGKRKLSPFKKENLVQIYRSNMDYTFKAERKMVNIIQSGRETHQLVPTKEHRRRTCRRTSQFLASMMVHTKNRNQIGRRAEET